MLEELIVRYCSPTLAGIKTGSIFWCHMASKSELFSQMRKINTKLYPKGVRILPLKILSDEALIYLYRPKQLDKDLSDRFAVLIMERLGYKVGYEIFCIKQLKKKLYYSSVFPHEIGLFLGFPPEDVYGFISNKANNYKISGCWKVYGDVGSAQTKFELFKICTRIFENELVLGTKIEQLTADDRKNI